MLLRYSIVHVGHIVPTGMSQQMFGCVSIANKIKRNKKANKSILLKLHYKQFFTINMVKWVTIITYIDKIKSG